MPTEPASYSPAHDTPPGSPDHAPPEYVEHIVGDLDMLRGNLMDLDALNDKLIDDKRKAFDELEKEKKMYEKEINKLVNDKKQAA